MSDIMLELGGDASGATAALKEVGDQTQTLWKQSTAMGDAQRKQSEEFWAGVTKAAAVAGAAVAAFGVSSLRAFAESERIQRQLTRAAGEYGEALGEQASQLSKLYAIDDDIIKQGQTLLVQWGGVGAATQDVTVATMNLAAAMGTDLQSATSTLIRNVENGGTGLAKMGIHFDQTGNKGEDLARAIAAINEKLGGAAAADAASLTGQARAATVAMEDLQKGFGQLVAAMVQKAGIIGVVRDALATYQELFFGDAQKQKNEAYLAMQQKIGDLLDRRKMVLEAITLAHRNGNDAEAGKMVVRLADLDAEIAKLKQLRDAKNKAIGAGLPGVGAVEGKTAAQIKAEEAAAAAAATKAEQEAQKSLTISFNEFNSETARKYREENAKGEDASVLASIRAEERRVAALKAEGEAEVANMEENSARKKEILAGDEKSVEESIKKAIQARDKGLEESRQQMLREEQAWADAGTAIGMALVNSVSEQLQRLMDGADMDAGEVMANIIGDILAVAGQVIGTAVGSAYGGYAGGQLGGAIGGAAGGLAGAGVKALGKAGRRSKYHDGGEIEGWPRFHSGGALGPGEVPLIGQVGEHMLSRRDVANMGGHAGVEAAKTGQRFNFTIQTIDAVGTRQFFENDGGRGFFNALRTGRGSLMPAFGGG